MRTNQEVTTPFGQGVIQGRWSASEWLVRLPVNDATRGKLGQSVTPRAEHSALFVFPEKALK